MENSDNFDFNSCSKNGKTKSLMPSKIKCRACGRESLVNWTQRFVSFGHCPICARPLLSQSLRLLLLDSLLTIILFSSLIIFGIFLTFVYFGSNFELESVDDPFRILILFGLVFSEFTLVLVPYARTKGYFKELIGLQWTSTTPFEIFFGTGTGFFLAFVSYLAFGSFLNTENDFLSSQMLIVLFAGLQILFAFSEEVFFRGYFQNSLQQRFPAQIALLTSALIFGLMHGVVINIFIAFLGGLILGAGYIYFEGRNHFGIALHCVYNATIILTSLNY